MKYSGARFISHFRELIIAGIVILKGQKNERRSSKFVVDIIRELDIKRVDIKRARLYVEIIRVIESFEDHRFVMHERISIEKSRVATRTEHNLIQAYTHRLTEHLCTVVTGSGFYGWPLQGLL